MNRDTVKLGHWFGVEVRADRSWFILVILVWWSFVGVLLPTLDIGLAGWQRMLIGSLSTFLFFGSVIAHELAHSVYANRSGLEIKRITLFVFGGAAELHEEPRSPRQEFLMAAAGPAMSILLSILFLGVTVFGFYFDALSVQVVGAMLASINFILALFNLLPGFPLDGGRIFRSIMWKLTGNFEQATKIAAAGGQLLAYLLIGLGIYRVTQGVWLAGFWIIFIALFLRSAAINGYRQSLAQRVLQEFKVRDFMRPSLPLSANQANTQRFLKTFASSDPTLLPATPPVKPSDDLSLAATRMAHDRLPGLPVIAGGNIIGYLYQEDIVRFVLRHTV